MKRRRFLQSTTTGLMLPVLAGGFPVKLNSMAQLGKAIGTISDKILVVIQLEGGNDGINMLVPSNQYAELQAIRPAVLSPQADLLALTGQSEVKLHPSMTGIRDLYDQGKVLFMQSVGYYQSHSSSHPSATRQILNGYGTTDGTSGWLGRFLETTWPQYNEFEEDLSNLPPHPLSVEFGSYNSLLTQGYTGSMSILLNNAAQFGDLWYKCYNGQNTSVTNGCSLTEMLPGMAGATNAFNKLLYLRSFSRLIEHYACILEDHFTDTAYTPCLIHNACPPPGHNELQKQLRIVADWIKNGLQTKAYLVRQGGYDTHSGQIYLQGQNLGDLSTAITDFLSHLGTEADKVIGVVVTEFGRTLKGNGSTGTDHATAYPTFLFGNKVTGGVMGQTPDIPTPQQFLDDFDFYNNLPVQHDVRRIYSTILKHWFCLDNLSVASILHPDGQNANIPDPAAYMAANQMVPLPLVDFACCPASPLLQGPPTGSAGNVLTYSVAPSPGNFYLWTVQGGEITAGGGPLDTSVTVQWNNVGQGSVEVKLL